jgi:hypothetical protein
MAVFRHRYCPCTLSSAIQMDNHGKTGIDIVAVLQPIAFSGISGPINIATTSLV